MKNLPDPAIFAILLVTFLIGYLMPLSLDPRVGYSVGWLLAIIGFVVVDLREDR